MFNTLESTQILQVGMVAGEASGDLLGSLLLEGMQKHWPHLQTRGIGGPRMAAQGFQVLWPYEHLSIHGYAEVLSRGWGILKIRRALLNNLLNTPNNGLYSSKPNSTSKPLDVFIGVDAPDFNLGLEKQLKRHGVPTVHFISPSVWAWRSGRMRTIVQSVDRMLCVFPFEVDFYRKHGMDAVYVGHPLAQKIPLVPDKAAARQALGLEEAAPIGLTQDTQDPVKAGLSSSRGYPEATPPQKGTLKNPTPLVAVLPGSRASEIKYLGPVFAQSIAQLAAQAPGMGFLLPTLPAFLPTVRLQLQQAGCLNRVRLLTEAGASHQALAACDVALVASGTATLEAALFKRPMVIAYRLHPLSWHLMRRMQLQLWIGLPNILCQDFVVPEFLQHAATPATLAQAVLAWCDAPDKVHAVEARFTQLHQELKRNTAQEACHAIEQLLVGRR